MQSTSSENLKSMNIIFAFLIIILSNSYFSSIFLDDLYVSKSPDSYFMGIHLGKTHIKKVFF